MRVRLKFRGAKMSENYSWRKRYQRGYGEESASPALKKVLDNRKKRPYKIEPFMTPEDRAIIEKLSTPPVTIEDRAIIDRNYNIPIVPEKDIPPAPIHQEEESKKNEMLKNLWKGLV